MAIRRRKGNALNQIIYESTCSTIQIMEQKGREHNKQTVIQAKNNNIMPTYF